MRSTSASPASMSTPASRYVSGEMKGVESWIGTRHSDRHELRCRLRYTGYASARTRDADRSARILLARAGQGPILPYMTSRRFTDRARGHSRLTVSSMQPNTPCCARPGNGFAYACLRSPTPQTLRRVRLVMKQLAFDFSSRRAALDNFVAGRNASSCSACVAVAARRRRAERSIYSGARRQRAHPSAAWRRVARLAAGACAYVAARPRRELRAAAQAVVAVDDVERLGRDGADRAFQSLQRVARERRRADRRRAMRRRRSSRCAPTW